MTKSQLYFVEILKNIVFIEHQTSIEKLQLTPLVVEAGSVVVFL